MRPSPLAETVAQIARRERVLAVKDGDYLLALVLAIVEQNAARLAPG